MKDKANIIKAVVVGHAVADALGVPVEFDHRESLDINPVKNMRGFGTYDVPEGAWSDDTSLSLAALDVLADGAIDWDKIMLGFGNWYYKNKYTPTEKMFDVGDTCARAINNYFFGKQSVDECGLGKAGCNGNGSLMRIHPFSLMAYFKEELRADFEPIIEKASALTHSHERSKLACKIYTLVLFSLIDDPSKKSIRLALEEAEKRYCSSPEFGAYARIFAPDFDKLGRNEIKSSGYVVDTLEAVLWCLLTTKNYKDCVLKAVNLGDDTDTVAAIAGGLAGALYGYRAIPKKWLDTLIKREYIEEMCQRAEETW